MDYLAGLQNELALEAKRGRHQMRAAPNLTLEFTAEVLDGAQAAGAG